MEQVKSFLDSQTLDNLNTLRSAQEQSQNPLELECSKAISDLNLRSFNVGELYSGPGGVGLGIAQARIIHNGTIYETNPLWINDYCPDSINTWMTNIPNFYEKEKGKKVRVEAFCGDIRQLDLNKLAEVEGLVFGFPCNDFSLVGEQRGIEGNYGPLYSYGIKVLQKQKNKPLWFMAENVSGITSSNDGKALEKILREMSESGYKLVAHKYKLEEYGIPQARHRVIVIGIRDDLDNVRYRVPAPNGIRRTAGDALRNINPNSYNHELTKQNARVIERLNYIKPGQNVWNADMPLHLRLNVPRTQLSHIYKRLDANKPSYTVTGSGGGGTHMYHWDEPRALTNRERARLQTFPDYFRFMGSKESVRKQIGMAIPVEAARIIMESVLKAFAGANQEPTIEANIRDDFK